MQVSIKLIIQIILLSLTVQAYGQDLQFDGLETVIDSLQPEAVSDATPGFVVGVVHDGELVLSKGFGLANLSYDIPNDPAMLYNVGSVAKQFLGFAFAMLHAEGKLNVNDPVSNYLDDWPTFEHTVTLRHLLTHTSGYREAYTISNLAGRYIGVDRLSKEECLNVVRRQPELEYVPGSSYTYNSTAYVILAEVLEQVTNESADIWVEQNILEPLGMMDTEIESYVEEVAKNSAESYAQHDDGTYENLNSNRAIFGAAEIMTNIPDLMKWVMNYDSEALGGKEVRDVFFDPMILNDGVSTGYGHGIGVGDYRGVRRYRHTGGHENFITQVSYYPDHKLGLITISNYGERGYVSTTDIADYILSNYVEPKPEELTSKVDIDSITLKSLEGLYLKNTLNDAITLSFSDGSLQADGYAMTPISPNEYSVQDWNSKIRLQVTEGHATLILYDNGPQSTYNRVASWEPDSEELIEYAGDYWSKEIETVYHVSVKEDQLIINHRWLGKISITPITRDVFSSNEGFSAKFMRNEMGEINNISINSGRTLNVVFDKQ